jgi:hypothetical protein
MLGGAAPIPASSGRTVRHRLNRGDDRQLNRALHTIALSRERHHEPTKQYVARRTAEAKAVREIRRCLERVIARQLYRLPERNSRSHDLRDIEARNTARRHPALDNRHDPEEEGGVGRRGLSCGRRRGQRRRPGIGGSRRLEEA